jgi:anion-transporting  ArsA/GET3 family ATPase
MAQSRRTSDRRALRGMDSLLASKEMIVVCGSGGVGKTTMSAALGAVAATQLGGRVLVITVDPARRLATALGLDQVGNTETQVDPTLLRKALAGTSLVPPPGTKQGELWVAMLDTKAGWNELIHRHAPDRALRDKILANPLYQNITTRFVHSHGYIAMERLHEIHKSGRYDLVIVDTPPSRNALDLLDAPGRMREFFGGRLLKWLTVPYRSRLFTAASKPFYQIADRILGSRFLQDIAEFFVLFQSMEKGFVARAKQVERLLVDPRNAFVVVSTLEAAPAHEACFLANELQNRRMNLGAIILNRTLPASIRRPAATKAARELCAVSEDPAIVRTLATKVKADPADVKAVLAEIGGRFHDISVVASREAERRAELEAIGAMTVAAPSLDRDVTDLAGLLELGSHVFRSNGRD